MIADRRFTAGPLVDVDVAELWSALGEQWVVEADNEQREAAWAG